MSGSTSTVDRRRIRANLVVRYVARTLGAEMDRSTQWGCPDLYLGPTWGVSAMFRDGRLTWRPLYREGKERRSHHCISVTTSIDRTPAAIAQDLRRRLLGQAKAWAAQCFRESAQRKEQRRVKRERLEELAAIVGEFRSDGRMHRAATFSIADFGLSEDTFHGFEINVRVRSWHCLLMIARLVAEDDRTGPEGTKPSDESAAQA